MLSNARNFLNKNRGKVIFYAGIALTVLQTMSKMDAFEKKVTGDLKSQGFVEVKADMATGVVPSLRMGINSSNFELGGTYLSLDLKALRHDSIFNVAASKKSFFGMGGEKVNVKFSHIKKSQNNW